MRSVKSHIFFSIIFLLLTHVSYDVYAQERINILNAQRGEGGFIDGEPVRKLIGNVQLSTDNMEMDADSVYQFENLNMIHAFNIQIETENDIIWADTLFHDTLNEYSRFRGRVVMLSEKNTLFSEALDYDRILDVALFLSPVRFEDESGILIAKDGYYFQNSDAAFFRGDVQLADSTQYLEADSLYMNRESEYYRLFGNVFAEDYEERVTLAGDYLEADSSGYRLLSGRAWMMQVNEAETDTSHLNAGMIHVIETDTSDFINAFQNVKIWSKSFAAIADTSHYRSDIEEFRLISNPVAWQRRIQLTGPYIEAFLEEDEIKFLNSYTRPIAVQQDSLTGRFNQMRGDTLQAFFNNGEIERIEVFDNSEIIFHLKDDDNEPDGLIELIAAGASIIEFYEGELDNFKANRNIDGSHLPEDPENIGRELSGFRWDSEMKPERPEIQQSRLPDISIGRPFELPDRYIRYMLDHEMIP
jgi:hypothetical protein